MKCSKLPRPTSILAILILVTSISIFVAISEAANANFIILPQDEHDITLSLQDADRVSGSFSVVSDDDSGVSFYITDPQNNTVLRYDNVKQRSFSFTVQVVGNYVLHFDNSVSTAYGKTVALNYDITHYIMDMPQEQFLFLVVVAVALVGILAFAVLTPK